MGGLATRSHSCTPPDRQRTLYAMRDEGAPCRVHSPCACLLIRPADYVSAGGEGLPLPERGQLSDESSPWALDPTRPRHRAPGTRIGQHSSTRATHGGTPRSPHPRPCFASTRVFRALAVCWDSTPVAAHGGLCYDCAIGSDTVLAYVPRRSLLSVRA
ncbi:hypothetical protein BC628DRAFT_995587 [Trametes gibbosa]|nr:hypothetical protein BC628DRAFT_995587 [Trametes gibbosa]